MSAINKEDAIETVLLVQDGCYNLEREPHIVIDELFRAVKYLSAERGVWTRAEDFSTQ